MRKLLILIIAIINLNAINIRPIQEQKYCIENKEKLKNEQEKIAYEIRCRETLSEKFMREINNKVKEVKAELNKKYKIKMCKIKGKIVNNIKDLIKIEMN